jgi:peroxiredoxin
MHLSYTATRHHSAGVIGLPGNPVKVAFASSPLEKGSFLPGFSLKENKLNLHRTFREERSGRSDLYRQLQSRALVVGFYTAGQTDHALQQLGQLNLLQPAINALGANLIIITADATGDTLDEIRWINSLSLNFYFDPEMKLAQSFGICDSGHVAWNEDDLPERSKKVLPAIYVLDPVKRIIFSEVDHSYSAELPVDEILNSIRFSYFIS